MTWAVVHCLHIIPVGDVVEYEESQACVCGPTEEQVTSGDGTPAFLLTHHSLDGREAAEVP